MKEQHKVTQGFALWCQACDHRWLFQPDVGITTETLLSRLRSNQTCPKCKNHSRAKGRRLIIVKDPLAISSPLLPPEDPQL